jgi:methanogenic corrinoid protein MtbC1
VRHVPTKLIAGFNESETLCKEVLKMNVFEQIVEATVAGDKDRCVALAQQVVSQGVDAFQAIQEGYTKGMTIVAKSLSGWSIFCRSS